MLYSKKFLASIVCALALSTGLIAVNSVAPVALAQADLGAITGTVADASGAVIAAASVTITNKATGAQRVTTSNAKGEYSITQINPGDYTISVTSSGFGTSTQDFTLTVGSQRALNVQLAVAGSQTQVSITADDTTTPNSENAEVSTVITNQQIQNLPLADRDPYTLVDLAGNASTMTMGGNRGVGYNLAGGRSSSVDILLDGAENTDVYAVGVGQTIPQDAMQEFSVVTSGEGAELGRASSGAVNVSTKSGTNQFHGDLYDYNRISTFASDGFNNNALYAGGELANPKSRYTHNQFGYYAGGPIVHDKLFFSSATEWTRIRSDATVVSEVPTPQLIGLSSANMQAYFAQYGTLATPINGRTYTGADLEQEGVFADVATIAKTNPAILTTPLFGTDTYQAPGDSGGGTPVNQWINFDRIDWTLTPKTSLYGRYIQQSTINPPGSNNTSPYAGYNTGITQFNHDLLVSVTHVFTSNFAENTKILLTRFNNQQPLGAVPVSPTLYTNPGGSVTVGSGSVYFPGYLPTSPGAAIPFGGPQNFIQIGEDLAWTHGKHNIKFGGSFLYIKDNRVFGAYENAVDALVTTGSNGALTNFLNGSLDEVEVALNPNGAYPCVRDLNTGAYTVTSACQIQTPATSPNFSRSNRYDDSSLYVQDTWHATPQLSLTAGLRWEVYGPQHSQQAAYDANFFPASGTNQFDDIRNGIVQTRQTAPDGRLWNLDLKQFGPRIGFAYDLTGNGKTVIRGGYSISYERNFDNVTFNVIQNPPNYGVIALVSTTNPTAISNNNLGAFGTAIGPQPLPNVTLRAVDPNIKAAYAHNWNLTLEHQLGTDTLVSIGYIGTRGIHNYSISNFNRSFSGINYLDDAPTTATGFEQNRLNPQYSNINWRGADGDSYYESVNVGVRSNNLHKTGLSVTANYTFGHSLDNTSSTFSDGANTDGGGTVLGYLDPFNHGLDLGNSDFDIRHRIAASLTYNLPFFEHSSNGLLKTVLGGFVASTIFTAQTGNPYSLYDCYFGYTECVRSSFVGQRPAKNSTLRDISSTYGPNTYSYQDFPAYFNADGSNNLSSYNEWVNPAINAYWDELEGAPAGTPICCSDTPLPGGSSLASGGFVNNMDNRNSYYGPGTWDEDLRVAKSFKFHERYGINLSSTFINVFNHANTFVNGGFDADVSEVPGMFAFKSGNRNTELEARFVF